ncbi:hypothetical protein MPLB_1120033 [Mesorhizobium sp. ORS 3324]|nr:hypothetical protein MPLB_1120033 [Mesorhizobium sp. ORS 3324]
MFGDHQPVEAAGGHDMNRGVNRRSILVGAMAALPAAAGPGRARGALEAPEASPGPSRALAAPLTAEQRALKLRDLANELAELLNEHGGGQWYAEIYPSNRFARPVQIRRNTLPRGIRIA